MKETLLFMLISLPFLSFGNDNELKICLTGSTEKALPKYGEAFVNGARMAMQDLSDADKRRVKLDVNYYESNPLAPLEKLQELRKSSCDAIIGFSTGNDLLLIEEDLRANPILTLSIYGDPQKTFNETPYLRTMQPSAEDLVNHLFSKLPFEISKDSKILVITAADRSEMLSYKEAYLKKLKNFQGVVLAEVIEQTHDLRQVEEALKKGGKWDYVVLLTRSLIAAELTDLVYQTSQPVVLGTKYFGSSDLPAYLSYLKNKKVVAYIPRQSCSCDQSNEYLKFRTKYIETFNVNPMSVSVDSYDATRFLLNSLRKSKMNPKDLISFANSKDAHFSGISSFQVTAGFKVSSSKRYLIKIDETGYTEVK